MKRRATILAASLLPASLLSASLAFAQGNTQSVPLPPPSQTAAPRAPSADALAWVQKHLAGWPQETQKLGAQLVTKYGPPAETTERQITWYGNGPWKRTTLYKEETAHSFASPHKDILEQTINYRVPLEKFAEIAQFDGSVVPNRTRGELTSTSDGEDTNFLALNVADDIVKGERNVEQALTYYAQIIRARMIKEPEPYLQALKFKPAKSNTETADPGEIAPLIRHMSGTESGD
jgi:hypothetical protein